MPSILNALNISWRLRICRSVLSHVLPFPFFSVEFLVLVLGANYHFHRFWFPAIHLPSLVAVPLKFYPYPCSKAFQAANILALVRSVGLRGS